MKLNKLQEAEGVTKGVKEVNINETNEQVEKVIPAGQIPPHLPVLIIHQVVQGNAILAQSPLQRLMNKKHITGIFLPSSLD